MDSLIAIFLLVEQLGAQIMEDLHSQRQTISRSRQRVSGSSVLRNVLPVFFFIENIPLYESF